MADWVLWCGCRLPSAAIPAHPDASRLREETCAVCGVPIAPHARAHRVRREDVPRPPRRLERLRAA